MSTSRIAQVKESDGKGFLNLYVLIRYLCCFVILVLLTSRPAFGIKVPRGLDKCSSLDACMKLLDTVVPAEDNGEGSNGEILARDLRRFGEPAKQELLKRAVGSHPGWRNVAGAILREWGLWKSSDVPALREALHKQPGGWVAKPLGEIANPDAIEALVEDLPKDSEDQTDSALQDLGEKAIPYLFPLLEDDQRAESAARVISNMRSLPASFATSWAALAIDSQKPLNTRLAALRGIAALGDEGQPVSVGLRGLLNDPDSKLQQQAVATLKAIHDSSVVDDVARSCHEDAPPFDPFPVSSFVCLNQVADYGENANKAGELLLPFLESKNVTERAYVITTFGMIGYSQAIPQIVQALNSEDWRVVYSAIRSLGWLGAKEAIPSIEKKTIDHWLPEVRHEAARVVTALRSPAGRVDRTTRTRTGVDQPEAERESLNVDARDLGDVPSCRGNRWIWKDKRFTIRNEPWKDARSLRFRDGEFVGTNHGEWGGRLAWLSELGEPVKLLSDNVLGLEYDEGDAIAMIGLSHMSLNHGYVLKISRTEGGPWSLTEVARLPGTPQGWTRLGPNLFAVLSARRAVVFSTKQGILGLATCDVR